MNIPDNIKGIIQRLEAHGHPAYAVGGCVRDSILCREPEDWDICTSALPEEIMAVFGADAIPTGLKHGTVTVRSDGGKAEVTTFRIDGTYTDHRHPDHVSFSSSLTADLSRRDFCMNAMALGLDGKLFDPFGGIHDIEQRLIRCVGDPSLRFEEDALRMFRALRFSAVLGFSVDPAAMDAIYGNAHLAAEIAPERIRIELEKLLLADDLRPITLLFESGLMAAYCGGRPSQDFTVLSSLPAEAMLRWAGLCALLAHLGASETRDLLEKLRCDRNTVRCCDAGVTAAMKEVPSDRCSWKRLLSQLGEPSARCAAAALTALGHTNAFDGLYDALRCGECWSLKELDIGGSDILALGYSGRETGEILRGLLAHVIEAPEDNEKRKLLDIVMTP